MNPNLAGSDLKRLRAAIGVQRYIIGALAGAVLLCLVLMTQMVGRERTILVPPVIEKSFWVAHDKVSGSYLEQMGVFAAYLILDVSPQSVDWKRSMLLQYASAISSSELGQRQLAEADRLKQLNAMTQFSVVSVTPREEDMSVVLRGRLATFVNGQRTTEVDKAYLARFVYSGGRIQLRQFDEKAVIDAEDKANAKQARVH